MRDMMKIEKRQFYFPTIPKSSWQNVRQVIREEISKIAKKTIRSVLETIRINLYNRY